MQTRRGRLDRSELAGESSVDLGFWGLGCRVHGLHFTRMGVGQGLLVCRAKDVGGGVQ